MHFPCDSLPYGVMKITSHSTEDFLPCEMEEHDAVMRELAEEANRRIENDHTSLTTFFDELHNQGGEVVGFSRNGEYLAAGGFIDANAILESGLIDAEVIWHVHCPDGKQRTVRVVHQVVRSWESAEFFRDVFKIAYPKQ